MTRAIVAFFQRSAGRNRCFWAITGRCCASIPAARLLANTARILLLIYCYLEFCNSAIVVPDCKEKGGYEGRCTCCLARFSRGERSVRDLGSTCRTSSHIQCAYFIYPLRYYRVAGTGFRKTYDFALFLRNGICGLILLRHLYRKFVIVDEAI